MYETILLAEALLKQLLVGAVDVAEPLAQVPIVTAVQCSADNLAFAAEDNGMQPLSLCAINRIAVSGNTVA